MGRSQSGPLATWIEGELALGAPRTILVDGFNVLHATLLAGERDAAWWGRTARERLLDRVGDWPEAEDVVWVAFDGREAAWSTGIRRAGPRVHSVFVPSADDWIVRCARRAAEPGRTIVVSADGQVAGRARSAGATVLTPWDFVARCRAADGPGAQAPGLPERGSVPEPDLEPGPGSAPEPELDPAAGVEVVAGVGETAADEADPAAPRPSPKTLS